jgi:hypothetical protein
MTMHDENSACPRCVMIREIADFILQNFARDDLVSIIVAMDYGGDLVNDVLELQMADAKDFTARRDSF